jgi:NADP-dependent 3-hydroxy acid dehydrogenase YdfG
MEAAAEALERWRGRVALVTGASSGIGRAVSRRLAQAGLRVAITARRRERIDALAKQIGEAGGEALALPADLRSEEEILGLFRALRERWGGVDVLVNNAGLGHHAPLLSGPSEAWREMLDVNVFALCVCTREAVRDMRERGDAGHVIHVGSMAGHRVPPGSGVYAASKFAVRALTEALRQELRRAESDVRVSCVSPGFVETGFHAHYYGSEEAGRRATERFPVLQPDDVAETVLHVLRQPAHVQIHDVLVRPTRQPN